MASSNLPNPPMASTRFLMLPTLMFSLPSFDTTKPTTLPWLGTGLTLVMFLQIVTNRVISD